MRTASLIFVIILISACSPFVTSTPPPSPQPVRIAHTSTTRPYVDRLYQCAQKHPEIAVIAEQTNLSGLGAAEVDLSLWFGEPLQGVSGNATSIGSDRIRIVGGDKVNLTDVNHQQLLDLFSNTNSPYQVWTYGESNDLRGVFEKSVLQGESISTFALLAPNPGAMIEAISQDPMAVGYLPESWLADDLKTISTHDELEVALTHPILVISASEPAGIIQAYLVCLQNPMQ